MPTDGKKGITVKIDSELHAEVRQYLESHEMTMAEFMTQALQDELHPKNTIKEEKYMGNMRTLALQIPEDLFQRIKDYLHRNNMTQKDFIIGLIEDELDRDQTERENSEQMPEEAAEDTEQEENADMSDFETVSEETENYDEEEAENDYSDDFEDENEESDYDEESDDESETDGMGFSMGM